jgi:hypothetical protein
VPFLLGFAAWLGLTFLGASALIFAGLGCDDHCRAQPRSWHDATDAWQYPALQVLAGAAIVAATLMLVQAARRRYGAAAALGVTAAAFEALIAVALA